MEKAASKTQIQKEYRNTIITECFGKEWKRVGNCFGTWLKRTMEILFPNEVEPVAFAVALRELVIKEREKF